jgi:hypothetical protein
MDLEDQLIDITKSLEKIGNELEKLNNIFIVHSINDYIGKRCRFNDYNLIDDLINPDINDMGD